MNEYPIGCRVILKDLTKTEFNGKVGIVQSKLNQNGRQQILLDERDDESEEKKILGLKPINLKLEPRPVDSLTTREMKTVLSRKDYIGSLAGFDKSDLKSLVEGHVTDPEEIASLLAKQAATAAADAAPATTTNGNVNNRTNRDQLKQQIQNQANQLKNISPDQLKQQAQMMRSMDPSMIRRMNPQMANFTDAQIQMAATQMEQMANNPQMVQGMVNQMSNMDDSQLDNMGDQFGAGGAGAGAGAGGPFGNTASAPGTTAASASGTPATASVQNGMQNAANMSPEQLGQQAAMMKSMSKDQLRAMNPLMANWPDSQIDMAIGQMEAMANNPEMSKKMLDQMKNMKPEDLEKMQKMAQSGSIPGAEGAGIGNGAGGAPGFDPSAMSQNPMDMLKNTNPAQIKQMLQMVKDNPALFKDMIRSANPGMADQLTDEQISKTMETFANLDEKKIGWIMKALGIAQSVRSAFKGKGMLFLLLSMSLFALALFRFMRRNNDEVISDMTGGVDDEVLSSMVIPDLEEDEF